MKSFNRQNGVALLEVLIAFVIVTISAVALYQLQNKYLRNEIASSARLTALNLAESKLDDLRTFGNLTVSGSVPAYDNIDTDQGGTIASGAVPAGNFNYDLHWTSTDTGDGSKDITVTVRWNNGNDEVNLFGSIARSDRISEAKLISTGAIKNYNPIVVYSPGAAPEVISLDIGGGYKQETTKPIPTVSTGQNSIQTQFTAVRYNASSANATQVESDFNTLSCNCSGSGTTNNTYLPASLDMSSGVLYWKVGGLEDKNSGTVASNQPNLCESCCTNHFNGTLNKFSEYYNQLNKSPSPVKSNYTFSSNSYTDAGSGNYIDSCRFVRLDGVYKPMPDWNLVKLVVMNSNFLLSSNGLAAYRAYVNYVIKSFVAIQQSQGTDWSNMTDVATASSTIKNFSAWLATDGSSYNTNINITLNKGFGSLQLVTRGIFIDIMDVSTTDFKNIDTTSDTYLQNIPFYDIDLTLLSRWSSSSAAVATVTDDQISSLSAKNVDYYNNGVYSRGTLNPPIKPATGSTTITVESYTGNSSVAAYPPPNKQYMEAAISAFEKNTITDSLNVTVSSSSGTYDTTISGKIYCFDSNGSCSVNTFKNISSGLQATNASCTSTPATSNSQFIFYNCNVNKPATGAVVTVTPPNNYSVNPGSLDLSNYVSSTSGGCFVVYKTGAFTSPPATCP